MSNQPKKADPATDRRKKTRYAISSSFPLKVVLALGAETGGTSSGAWKDWPGTLVDLSASGAHVQVNLAAVAFPDSPCRLKLSLGNFKIEIPSTVAHFVCSSRLAVCGVRFDFSNAGVEQTYFRVLEPAIIGASLARVEDSPDDSGSRNEHYAWKTTAQLAVARESPGGEVSGIEFRIKRCVVDAARAAGGDPGARPALRLRTVSADDAAPPLTDAQEQEARWMFRLAASNLSAAVPADVRRFLLSLAW